nr:SDR family NAD(P)-dependent oxidoreductase [Deinococcus budaensis]
MAPYLFGQGAAVLTGAAGGIGSELARQLAAKGSPVALIDRDQAGLEALAAELRGRHPARRVSVHPFDLTRSGEIPALAGDVLRAHPRVSLLVNNAGLALGGTFEQVSAEQFGEVMAVNFGATVALTRSLLPALRSELGAHIVNVSSLFGLIGPAGQSAYAASKFAVRGFSEVLRHELAPQGIGLSVVHPGGVRTGIARNARIGQGVPAGEVAAAQRDFERLLRLDPAEAARLILRGVETRAPRVIVGPDARVLDLLARLLPGTYWPVVQTLMRVQR